MYGDHEQICIRLSRLEQLESDSKDLARAKALIARLRAENEALKAEKKLFVSVVDSTRRHISVAGNSHKKWAVLLVKKRLEKARLI